MNIVFDLSTTIRNIFYPKKTNKKLSGSFGRSFVTKMLDVLQTSVEIVWSKYEPTQTLYEPSMN